MAKLNTDTSKLREEMNDLYDKIKIYINVYWASKKTCYPDDYIADIKKNIKGIFKEFYSKCDLLSSDEDYTSTALKASAIFWDPHLRNRDVNAFNVANDLYNKHHDVIGYSYINEEIDFVIKERIVAHDYGVLRSGLLNYWDRVKNIPITNNLTALRLYDLAVLYDKDDDKKYVWLQKYAEQCLKYKSINTERPEIMYILSEKYFTGTGVIQDYCESYYWYLMAESLTHINQVNPKDNPNFNFSQIQEHLTVEQISQIQDRAKNDYDEYHTQEQNDSTNAISQIHTDKMINTLRRTKKNKDISIAKDTDFFDIINTQRMNYYSLFRFFIQTTSELSENQQKQLDKLLKELIPLTDIYKICDEQYAKGKVEFRWLKIECCLFSLYYYNELLRVSFDYIRFLEVLQWVKDFYKNHKDHHAYYSLAEFIHQHKNNQKYITRQFIDEIRDALVEGYSMGDNENAFHIYDLDLAYMQKTDTGLWLERFLEFELRKKIDNTLSWYFTKEMAERRKQGNGVIENPKKAFYWYLITNSLIDPDNVEIINDVKRMINQLRIELVSEGTDVEAIRLKAEEDFNNYHSIKWETGGYLSDFNEVTVNQNNEEQKNDVDDDKFERLIRIHTNLAIEHDKIQHPNPDFELSDWVILKPSDFTIKYYMNVDKKSKPKFMFCYPSYKNIIKPEKFIVKRLRELIKLIDRQSKGELTIPYWTVGSPLSKNDVKEVSQIGSVDKTVKDKSRKGPMITQYLVTDFNSFIKSSVKDFQGTPLEWQHTKGASPTLKSNVKIEVIYK
jgi:hypothetical protein